MGLPPGSFTASITPLGNSFEQVGNPKVYQGFATPEKHTDSISCQVTTTLHVGDTIRYVLNIDSGYFIKHDTVMRIFGYPVTVFNNKLTANSNWTGKRALTRPQFIRPIHP